MMEIHNTTIFNDLLKAFDMGMTVLAKDINEDHDNFVIYYPISNFSCAKQGNLIGIRITVFIDNKNFQGTVFPSNGYSSSDLYIPKNIQINEIEPKDPVS